jgi:hypothetical protein
VDHGALSHNNAPPVRNVPSSNIEQLAVWRHWRAAEAQEKPRWLGRAAGVSSFIYKQVHLAERCVRPIKTYDLTVRQVKNRHKTSQQMPRAEQEKARGKV